MSRRTDTCVARDRYAEVDPTTKVINGTRTVWNFQRPAWSVGEMSWNFILVAWWEPECSSIRCKFWYQKLASYFDARNVQVYGTKFLSMCHTYYSILSSAKSF